jgi:CrcB protein
VSTSRRRPGLRRQADVLAVVAVGGGLGSLARYGLELGSPAHPGRFPGATLLINVTGSFVLGALMVSVLEVWPRHRYLRPFATVGFLGGFTTFSTHAADVRDLAAHRAWMVAGSYAGVSLLAGLAAVWLGATLARVSRRPPVRRGR